MPTDDTDDMKWPREIETMRAIAEDYRAPDLFDQ
jgi:hypothetical protein